MIERHHEQERTELDAVASGRDPATGRWSSRRGEHSLLDALLRHPDQVLSREQLLSIAWGYDFDPGSNVVDVDVRYLRRTLGEEVIETVRGMGYPLPVR